MRFFRRNRGERDAVPADTPAADDARVAAALRGRELLGEIKQADQRWAGAGDPAGLRRAAEAFVELANLSLTPADMRAGALNEAGSRYLSHHQDTGDPDSLDLGRLLLVEAAEGARPDALGMVLANLGAAWRTTYERTDDPADLRRALEVGERAVAGVPAGSPHRPAALANLAVALRETYRRDGDPAALDRAIDLDEEALAAAPPGSPGRSTNLNGLANGLSLRLSRRADVGDANRLVRCREEALALARPGTRIHRMYLENLSNAYAERAPVTTDVDDLDRSVELGEQALAAVPQGSPDRATALFNVGGHVATRHAVTGRAADLDRAVDLTEQALGLLDRGGRDRLSVANNLAGLLRSRFNQLGTFDDLERCIALLQESVELTPAASPEAATRWGNLGNALRARFLRNREEADLVAAIAAYERGRELAPEASPVELNILNNLGTAVSDRYEATGDEDDLERARDLYARVHERSAPGSPGRRGARNNQARIVLVQARRTRSVTLAREAVALATDAVTATPVDTPESLIYRNNLGSAQELAGELTDDPELVRAGLATLRGVVTAGRDLAPELGLDAARVWGRMAEDRAWWPEAADAYRMGRECLDQLYRRQGRRDQKESWLEIAVGMAPRAAYALVRAGDLRGAVVSAETGRAVLMTETVERAATGDLTALARDGHEELAAAYQDAVDALAAVDRGAPDAVDRTAASLPGRSAADLRRAVDTLAARIRSLPGHADFRRPPGFADVEAAAAVCPVVYLAPATTGAVALVVFPTGTVEAVDLPLLTRDELGRQVARYSSAYEAQHGDFRRWASTLLDVTRWLWPAVMEPVVRALAGAPRAVVVPMGTLGLLPLHAAWRDSPGEPTRRRYVLDDVLLTYAPNARSTTRARQVAPVAAADGVLVVADPAPVLAAPLLHARREGEAVRASFGPGVLLAGRAADRARVLAEMARWPVVHFACHADSNPAEPLDSHLLLAADEKIRLGDLIAVDTIEPKVVVLSACETALIGTDIPDEVVSLPIGFLQAGARSVVASFWPVNDESTAALMQRFYELWRGRDTDSSSAVDLAHALREAQQWVRDRGAPGRAAPAAPAEQAAADRDARVGEAGRDMDTRDHPVFWAAFSYFGA